MPSSRPSPRPVRRPSAPLPIVAVALIALVMTAGVPAHTLAASPSPLSEPSPSATGALIGSGDPRSEGEGPGLVGDPLLVALGVIALGALASGATLLYVRLTRDG